jgi:hypothetical protein
LHIDQKFRIQVTTNCEPFLQFSALKVNDTDIGCEEERQLDLGSNKTMKRTLKNHEGLTVVVGTHVVGGTKPIQQRAVQK